MKKIVHIVHWISNLISELVPGIVATYVVVALAFSMGASYYRHCRKNQE